MVFKYLVPIATFVFTEYSHSFVVQPNVVSMTRKFSSSTISMIDDAQLLDHVLKVAVDASKKAGNIILENSNGADVSERKANSRDLLTLIDPLCEKVCYHITTMSTANSQNETYF
jgi:Ca2+-dependent lipid-binding protein